MTFLLTLLAAIFVLGPLIALHEWGHYIVARLCGVKVLTYSIGFGPKLFGWTSKKVVLIIVFLLCHLVVMSKCSMSAKVR